MKKKYYIYIIILLIFTQKLFSEIDSCWTLIYPFFSKNGVNPDSVMVDTCVSKNIYATPKYAKQWFEVFLPYHALLIPCYTRDTLILKNWRDIDTSFSELRQGFENLETKYGNFVLKKKYLYEVDSNSLASKLFSIRFDNYVNIDSVISYLEKIPDITDPYYLKRYAHWPETVEEGKLIDKIDYKIFPNPAYNYLNLQIINKNILEDKIEIYSIACILMKRIDISQVNKEQTIQIDLNNFYSGTYILKLNNQVQLFQVIK